MGELVKTLAKETRLRREPTPDAEVLLVLPQGTEVEVLAQDGRFSQVRRRDSFRDTIGWVASGFIGREPEPPPPIIEREILPCQRCHGEDWTVLPVWLGGQNPHSILLDLGFLDSQRLMARVCLCCGHTELTVPEQGLEHVRQVARRQSRD